MQIKHVEIPEAGPFRDSTVMFYFRLKSAVEQQGQAQNRAESRLDCGSKILGGLQSNF